MERLMCYVIDGVTKNEIGINEVKRFCRKQMGVNKTARNFMLLTIAYIWLNELNGRKQKEMIKKLKAEIEELKNTKGE